MQKSRADHVCDQQTAATVWFDPVNPADGVGRELCALLRLEIESVEVPTRWRSCAATRPSSSSAADTDRSENQAIPINEQSIRDVNLIGALNEDR